MRRVGLRLGSALVVLGLGCTPTQVTQERATESTVGEFPTGGDSFDDDDNPPPDDDSNPPPDDDTPPDDDSDTTPPDTDGKDTESTGETEAGATSDDSATGTTGASTTGDSGGSFFCADEDLGMQAPDVMYSGNNVGETDALLGSCTNGVNGDEFLLTWTAPAAGSYFIDTIGSDIDTVLYILDECGGSELACNDDISDTILTSSLTIDLAAGEQILIVVDGFDDEASGDFELFISE